MKKFEVHGFTLIEMLVVIGVFAVLAIIATQSVMLSVRGTRKAEATGKLRGNLEYALGVMERRLRMATGFDCSGNPDQVDFNDELDGAVNYRCDITGNDDNIYYQGFSGGLLNTDEIDLTACTITCDVPINPREVTVTISAQEQNVSGAESARIDLSTNITLRNF